MNTRPLNEAETRGLVALNRLGFPNTLLFLTETGLGKSILDATEPVRKFLIRHGIHNYDAQAQGPAHKVELSSWLLSPDAILPLNTSLYRPITKSGDPRIWPYSLGRHATGGDVMAIIVLKGKLGFINLSRYDIASALVSATRLAEFLAESAPEHRRVADELLAKLRSLAASGPIKSVGFGDTTIGMTIENALGIPPNSSRTPDFKGIEIKSGRSKATEARETRPTLFACVPDWTISRLKSSAEILEEFGYERGLNLKLYCTVSSRQPNSQGLFLKVDDAARILREMCTRDGLEDVAVWSLAHLEERLSKKHRETFWVKAKVEKRKGSEWFHLDSVIHTQDPNPEQFQRLLSDGGVTVDHLIKRLPSGKTSEKGPLFKIARSRIAELFFGEPQTYSLLP